MRGWETKTSCTPLALATTVYNTRHANSRSPPASPQRLCLALSCACGLAVASADVLGSGANSSGKKHQRWPYVYPV